MKRSEQFADIRAIADDVCANTVSDEQLNQLEQKLRGNPEAKRFYFDYLRVHNGLKAAADRNMDLVYRRMTEEVVLRPSDDGGFINEHFTSAPNVDTNKLAYKNKLLFAIIFTLCFVCLFWLFYHRSEAGFTGKIISGQVAIVGQGALDLDRVTSGEYQVMQNAVIALDSGDMLTLTAGSKIKLFTDTEMKLKAGKLTLTAVSGSNMIIHGSNFRLKSNGDSLSVDLTNKQPIVTTGKNTSLTADRWRPNHYWAFEGQTDSVINSASNAYGIATSGATRSQGLVGEGAFSFNNSAQARIELGTGGGTAPATGSFSVTDGITIEALIQPNYTGKIGEMDEIFRKGHLDGEHRVSLGLHYTRGQHYLKPLIKVKQSISFGLYLVGQGYHELKLPLDGQEGRPSLAELKNGQTQHVVASYNVQTGIKVIYINGQQLAFYQYPPGSKMLSGGPGKAVIGNNPTKKLQQKFAFSGTIDEVAFYDFAVPPFTVKQHFAQVQQGINYYGLQPNSKALPEQVMISLPANKTIALDSLTGLPERLID